MLLAFRFDATTQGIDLGAYHVHANTTARQRCHVVGCAEAAFEDQLHGVFVTDGFICFQQVRGNGFFANARHIQPFAIIAHSNHHLVARLLQVDFDVAGRLFAGLCALIGRFDAMHHGVAQQMFKGRRDTLDDVAIHGRVSARDIQCNLLAVFFGGLAHHAIQAFGQAVELDHSRAQQIALQFARLTRLNDQVVFGRLHGANHVTLHRGHVIDRFGHHARQFLHAGKAVEFQRVEVGGRFGRLRHARLHLRFSLQLHIPQLGTQSAQAAIHIGHGLAQLLHFGLQAGAADHDLARAAQHAIKHVGTHPHLRLYQRLRRWHRRRKMLLQCRNSPLRGDCRRRRCECIDWGGCADSCCGRRCWLLLFGAVKRRRAFGGGHLRWHGVDRRGCSRLLVLGRRCRGS